MGELLEQLHNKHQMLWSLSAFPASHRMGIFYFRKIVRDSNDHNCLPRHIHIHSSISYWLVSASLLWITTFSCFFSLSHSLCFLCLNFHLVAPWEAFAQWPSSLFPRPAISSQYLQLCQYTQYIQLLSLPSPTCPAHIFSCSPISRPPALPCNVHFSIQSSHHQPDCSVSVIPGASLAWLSKAQLLRSRAERVWALVQVCRQLD